MTKQQQAIINSYNRSTATTLSDVYGRYSRAKENAYERIRYDYMVQDGGTDFRILSHNSQFFACAYKVGYVLKYFSAYRWDVAIPLE